MVMKLSPTRRDLDARPSRSPCALHQPGVAILAATFKGAPWFFSSTRGSLGLSIVIFGYIQTDSFRGNPVKMKDDWGCLYDETETTTWSWHLITVNRMRNIHGVPKLLMQGFPCLVWGFQWCFLTKSRFRFVMFCMLNDYSWNLICRCPLTES